SANMEFPEKPAFAAVAERQQIRNLYALGRLLGSRRGQKRYLVHQQGLLAARFSREKTPRTDLWSSGEIWLQGFHCQIYRRKVRRGSVGRTIPEGRCSICRSRRRAS